MLSVHVLIITLIDIFLDFRKIGCLSLFGQLFPAAQCADMGTCCQIDFQRCVRQNSSNIAAVHHKICILRHLLLQLHEFFPYFQIGACRGCHLSSLLGAQSSGDIDAI